jgi:hypothetical protein
VSKFKDDELVESFVAGGEVQLPSHARGLPSYRAEVRSVLCARSHAGRRNCPRSGETVCRRWGLAPAVVSAPKPPKPGSNLPAGNPKQPPCE